MLIESEMPLAVLSWVAHVTWPTYTSVSQDMDQHYSTHGLDLILLHILNCSVLTMHTDGFAFTETQQFAHRTQGLFILSDPYFLACVKVV